MMATCDWRSIPAGVLRIGGTAALLFAACGRLHAAAPEPKPIEGLWRNPSASVVIAIAPCGRAFCGTVQWASPAAQRDAVPGTNHLIGSNLLTDIRANGSNWTGRLFIPDENLHATARLQLLGPDRLKVTGCVFVGLLCDSQIWVRTKDSGEAG